MDAHKHVVFCLAGQKYRSHLSNYLKRLVAFRTQFGTDQSTKTRQDPFTGLRPQIFEIGCHWVQHVPGLAGTVYYSQILWHSFHFNNFWKRPSIFPCDYLPYLHYQVYTLRKGFNLAEQARGNHFAIRMLVPHMHLSDFSRNLSLPKYPMRYQVNMWTFNLACFRKM